MGSRRTGDGAENIYAATQDWVDAALRKDDSLFTPGKPIWSSQWLEELHQVADEGSRNLPWLEPPLSLWSESAAVDVAPQVRQLMAEMFYVNLLIPHGPLDKLKQVERVLRWGPDAEIPPELVAALDDGLIGTGMYHSGRVPNLRFLIKFARQWKEESAGEHERLLGNPYEFKKFAYDVEEANRSLREAMLHLVFPDTFEAIVNVGHKRSIGRTFANLVTQKTDDVDRDLQQIRPVLEAEHGAGIHLYEIPIRMQWDETYKPDLWDEFIRRMQRIDPAQLQRDEVDPKVFLSGRLKEVREAVLNEDADWQDLVKKKGIPSGTYPIINPRYAQPRLKDWVDEFPNAALKALQAIWTKEELSDSERILAFVEQLPWDVIRGAGTRLTVASQFLMALDVEQYPPYRTEAFRLAYDRTGYGRPPGNADEIALYEHALGFLDRFISEAKNRGLELRHRLDAQGLVWMSQYEEFWNPPDNGGVQPPIPPLRALAEELYLTEPADFLHNIDELLTDKKQVIFQGPPGTGKTYVAQKLANHLAGSEDRVTLVQFHPSYAYEDFVQGFRPKTGEDGQPRFELKDGPLRQVAKRAEDEPGEKHFLIIDEINRGQLSKVLGELYFLLEYRDKEIRLQYSDEPFSLPENLYIIGTMNTADRSIALVDAALRRRFYFVEFHPDREPVKSVLRKWLEANDMTDMMWVADVVQSANKLLKDDRHAAIGPSYFMKKDGLNEGIVERIWKHNVIPYIEERLFEDPERLKEFALPKLRGLDGGTVEQDAQLEENGESGDPETTQSEDQRQ